ncbi:NifB/NifX family molybdenum-iron cluster-binding protein [uncultured Sunxiuqinia sp.]|uniref:NifB/NifX family molybdenum-iron cluster-binding protein n=1 Tax=Sunxiuqinia rutila TaxID=1397841 RepID=UPI00262A5AF9|nr:NifB/NifX family molybdenum-iron cluster-binding protein [uncultured Sunxiuqinia sp.]
MKVAITSSGKTGSSKIDNRFGRCAYFAIHDLESDKTEFIKNPNKDVNEGAGPAAAQLIASQGVKKIISGEFGGKVKTILEDLQIQMIMVNGPEQTVEELIRLMTTR